MSSMDEVDGAYLKERLEQLENKVKLQDDLHVIEKSTGRRWSIICWVLQMFWLLVCTVLITIILTDNSLMLPVGTVMAWLPEDNLPDGKSLIRFYKIITFT